MILQLSPDAPLLAHMAAKAALALHIGGGTMGMASGTVAILARRGGRLHRVAGTVFVISMLAMAGVGAIVSPMMPDDPWVNTTAAVLTLYLVLTSWVAARRRPGQVGRFEALAAVVPVGVIVVTAGLAFTTAGTSAAGGVAPLYLFAVFATIAAVGDVVAVRRGLSSVARVTRHLWRMGLALFIAVGSFFLGQQRVMPKAIQGSPLLYLPVLFVIGALLFWLIRIRVAPWLRRRVPIAPSPQEVLS